MSEENDSQGILIKGGIAVLILVIAGMGYLLSRSGSEEQEDHPLLIKEGKAELTKKPGNPFPESDDDDLPEFKTDSGSVSPKDFEYALSVPGDPLVVVLPEPHANLGQISVEKYDAQGNPTGQPLKRGTPVQIPDPNQPGEKIYFKVP